jgi:peptidoglycan/LPS O-acetylase OafA/YrhL
MDSSNILLMNERWRSRLAKVTLLFAVLLISLGLIGFFGTGHTHFTALIPAWIGLALGLFGWLAISPNESRRKLFMHINVTIALLGVIGTGAEIIRSSFANLAADKAPNLWALYSKLTLELLLLVYVLLCVRSFIAARRSGRV